MDSSAIVRGVIRSSRVTGRMRGRVRTLYQTGKYPAPHARNHSHSLCRGDRARTSAGRSRSSAPTRNPEATPILKKVVISFIRMYTG